MTRSIVHSFPAPHPAQLLFDCTGLEAPPDELCGLLRDCLTGHPPDVRVHLVRWRDGTLRQDWAGASALLGLPPPAVPPDVVEAGAGDVLVCLAPAVEPEADAFLRRRGVVVLDVASAGLARDGLDPTRPADQTRDGSSLALIRRFLALGGAA